MEQIITANPEPLLNLNREQLFEGLDSEGKKLTPAYRNRAYAQKKNARNPNPGLGTPDLKATGSFYRGWFLGVDNGTVIFSSRDEKTPALAMQYGPAIFGLTTESKAKYRIILWFELAELIKQITGCI